MKVLTLNLLPLNILSIYLNITDTIQTIKFYNIILLVRSCTHFNRSKILSFKGYSLTGFLSCGSFTPSFNKLITPLPPNKKLIILSIIKFANRIFSFKQMNVFFSNKKFFTVIIWFHSSNLLLSLNQLTQQTFCSSIHNL